MGPRLRDLGPFLLLFRPFSLWLLSGWGLAVLTLASSWGLLGLSGGFLTATGLAGLDAVAAQLFNVINPSGGIRAFALLRTVGRWSERVVNHEATFRLLGQLRVWLYARLSRLSPRQLGLWHGAQVLNRLTRDVDLLDNLFIRVLIPLAASAVVVAFLVGLLAWFDLRLALPALGLAAFGLIFVPSLAYRAGRTLAPGLVQRQEGLRRVLLDLIEGLDEWALHRPSWERQRAKVLAEDGARLDDQTALQRRGAWVRAVLVAAIGLVGWATLGLEMTFAPGIGPDGPWAVALVLLVLGMGEALMALPAAWLELPGTALAARRLTELAEQSPDPAFHPEGREWAQPGGVPDLAVDGVSFAYDEDQTILDNLTFTLKGGSHVALLGPSGEGKTTLVRLLTRLEDPSVGTIRICGRDLREFSESALRSSVVAAMQDPWIFTDTIAENLRLAAPSATDDELWRILDLVGLADQISAWPQGLATWVEEGGQSLSGGQRRRLALARTLLRKADITLFDEPTEGLETQAAQALVAAVRQELAGRTLLWVTHRFEGVDDFPQVWTMKKGTLIYEGRGPR